MKFPVVASATVLLLASSSSTTTSAFVVPTSSFAKVTTFQITNQNAPLTLKPLYAQVDPTNNNDVDTIPEHDLTTATSNNNDFMSSVKSIAISAMVLATTTLPQAAFADSPDWGLFEGKTGSLLHPVMMAGLFVYSLYTGFLGLQWKRQRTIGDEINTLKATLPKLSEPYTTYTEAVSGTRAAGESTALWESAIVTEQQIKDLQTERKSLAEFGPRDKHFAQGALLAFVGTAFAIEGPLNTYARAGKLFPGPHLYVGAALVVIWSLAVATIPSMQKGNDVARKVHVGANIVGLGFFGWQVTSGIPILLKVWEKTSWP